MRERLNYARLTLAILLPAAVIVALWLVTGGASSTSSAAETPPRADTLPATVTFDRHIRPILSDRCFACHGPDINKRISGLRLDKAVEAFGPLPKHPTQRAFVPGHPEQSWAYLRMISKDPNEMMPPPRYHRTINDYERALVKKWIEQGAKWEEHWAFVKPLRAQPPTVQNNAWPRNDIDRFVLANLEEQGLQPSKEADKTRLIRRVSLDLTGIPPTPAEVDAFVADGSSNAYEKVVDRLLASQRYGEQMAVPWLDNARYADSHGFQNDPERFMWHWRDWVINAFNNNMPFDEFTVDQIAGDLLPNATDDQKIATGFNRNPRINAEGGVIVEEFRIEGVIDRVEATSQTWLGLTMGCCRCHDHKYDPITQKEFYQFSAYFNSINEIGAYTDGGLDKGANAPPLLRVYSTDELKRLADDKTILDTADAKLVAFQNRLPELEKQYAAHAGAASEPADLAAHFLFDDKQDGRDAAGNMIRVSSEGKPAFVDGPHGKTLKLDGAGSALVAHDAVSFERDQAASYGAWVKAQGTGAILARMDGGPDVRGFDIYYEGGKISAHLVSQWPSDAIKVTTNQPLPMKQWVHVMVTYDGSSKAGGLRVYFDGVSQPVSVMNDSLKNTIVAQSSFRIGRRTEGDSFKGLITDVRFYRRALTAAEVLSLVHSHHAIESIIQIPLAKRTAEQSKQLMSVLLAGDPEYAKVIAEIDNARADSQSLADVNQRGLGGPNTTMVMQDLSTPRDTFILLRGQYDKHGEKVGPGVPAILPPLPADAPPNRLALARWIVEPSNPLTSRVQANRLWEKFFGIGLVKSSENLGTQADWPSNPELLDWLATEMIRLKWDLKAFQKEIVMTAAYRQDSSISPEMLERDPENRLIARGPRVRLAAETVRDQALSASGLLVEKIGGPSVRPYEPEYLWDGNPYGNLSKYTEDQGDSLYRRSLYTILKRTAPPANLGTFDMPSREVCVVKRARTNTPLQALDLLNDPTYVEAARMLAQHMMTDGGPTPADRLSYGFYRVLCRKPSDAETRILVSGFEKQLKMFQSNSADATQFIRTGFTKPDAKLEPAELAAYAMMASEMLNLDEAVTKQ
jgi:hypothetical protein